MVLKVVTMAEMRFEVLLEVERTGLTVAEVCRRYGISRGIAISAKHSSFLSVKGSSARLLLVPRFESRLTPPTRPPESPTTTGLSHPTRHNSSLAAGSSQN